MPGHTDTEMLGLAFRFVVTIDEAPYDLGAWSKVEGLQVTLEVEKYEELGENDYIVELPKRAQYQHVKLTRAMTAQDSPKVQQWLQATHSEGKGTSLTIKLFDAHAMEVIGWTLRDAMPYSWTGPVMDAKQSAVATETLELRHHGFLGG